MGPGDIDPYKWSAHAENHKEQHKEIIKYFNTHLKLILLDEVVIEDIANKKEFLNICKGLILPFNIHDGTDIILVEKDCVVGKVLKPGICATLEFKKVVEEQHIGQAVLEMIITDCFVNKKCESFWSANRFEGCLEYFLAEHK